MDDKINMFIRSFRVSRKHYTEKTFLQLGFRLFLTELKRIQADSYTSSLNSRLIPPHTSYRYRLPILFNDQLFISSSYLFGKK